MRGREVMNEGHTWERGVRGRCITLEKENSMSVRVYSMSVRGDSLSVSMSVRGDSMSVRGNECQGQ